MSLQPRGEILIIQSYGLFWRADEIEWFPGKGNKGEWRLLGRRGAITGNIEMADFRQQTGIYILYGNYGAHYVGLTRKRGLGSRLKDHTKDDHKEQWDRFSWFGFRTLNKATDDYGLRILKKLPLAKSMNPREVIGDVEAMLIKAMDVRNGNQMNFKKGQEWTQVPLDQVEKYMDRL
jgi:hypothetical protein